MKKISTIKLLGLLVILVLVYASTEFFSSTGRSRQFREELVSIDTEKVTEVQITKGANTIRITVSEERWKVSTNEGIEYEAQEDRIMSSLSSIQTIKPSRVASRNPEKWQEFQVDSAGTRVQVFEKGEKSLDIVIGRFGMQGQQQFHSYVRLFDDDNVYVAENFMGFSVPTDEASYRNQMVTSFSRDSVTTLKFVYPADSSFTLQKSINGEWISEGFYPDSTKTAQFFNSLSKLNSAKFNSDDNISGLIPAFQAIIEIMNKEPIVLAAIAKNDSTYIITSSQNAEGRFEDQSLFDKIFKPKSSFYPEIPAEETQE
jgi:hypothetical protein